VPRYCIIKGGTVRNVIEASSAIASAIAAETGSTAVQSNTANLGDDWDGTVFTPNVPQTHTPDQTTRYQFVEACEDTLGVTQDAIESAITTMPNGRAKRQLKSWWTGSFVLQRKSQRMNELQSLMGWSNAQVRQLFQAAGRVGD
jgi:hypothetical protein